MKCRFQWNYILFWTSDPNTAPDQNPGTPKVPHDGEIVQICTVLNVVTIQIHVLFCFPFCSETLLLFFTCFDLTRKIKHTKTKQRRFQRKSWVNWAFLMPKETREGREGAKGLSHTISLFSFSKEDRTKEPLQLK